MDARPVSASQSVLVRWMGIEDANATGFVHGGTVMKFCDEAAGVAAARHSGRRVVTAGVDRMTFLVPVLVGQVVSFLASVNACWRTSMEVGVRVEAENIRTRERHVSNTAYLTMVALDDDGHPAGVPGLITEDATEERREREAQLRRTNRLAERRQIVEGRA